MTGWLDLQGHQDSDLVLARGESSAIVGTPNGVPSACSDLTVWAPIGSSPPAPIVQWNN